MKVKEKIIRLLGGVPREHYDNVVWQVEHLAKGRELDHSIDGVKDLFAQMAIDALQEECGDRNKPIGGAKRADIIEMDEAIWDRARSIADELNTFVDGIKHRNRKEARWGCMARVGVQTMMSMAGGRDTLLGRFALIWNKEHKDDVQKRLLTPDQVKEWKSFPTKVKFAANKLAELGYRFWQW